MMRAQAARRIVAACLLSLCAGGAVSQEKPLRRTFSPGTEESYRVELTVRSELRGDSAETIGAKTYVRPFLRAAEAELAWTASRRILSVAADGSAEMEESREHVVTSYRREPEKSEDARKMQESLEHLFESWKKPLALRYREAPDGHIQGLKPEEAAGLEEENPRLLTLWMLHALRPGAILPAAPLRFGERWQRAPQGSVPPWVSAHGSETGEWAAPPGEAATATLHITQELSGEIAPVRKEDGKASGRERAAPRGSFFADSLSTLSLLDASLLSAARSAAHETSWTLDPVEGLPEPPRFSSKLSVSVMIHRLP